MNQDGDRIFGAGKYGDRATTVTGHLSSPRRLELSITVLPGLGGATRPFTFRIDSDGDTTVGRFQGNAYDLSICPCFGLLTRK